MYFYRQAIESTGVVCKSLLENLIFGKSDHIHAEEARLPIQGAGTVLILGAGWVGRAFAAALLEKGYTVYATTTRKEKAARWQQEGIEPILADFDDDVDRSLFPAEVDFVLNSIPATKRLEKVVLEQRFSRVAVLLKTITYRKHLFLSSVGVYPDETGEYTEDYPVNEASNLRIAEKKMLHLPHSLIFRLGGLFGNDRILAKYFQHKVCTIGAQLANFIHIADLVRLIGAAREQHLNERIYNVVTPQHPSKAVVIQASAERYGFALPSAFDNTADFQKIVSGKKLQQELNYSFLYESPLFF